MAYGMPSLCRSFRAALPIVVISVLVGGCSGNQQQPPQRMPEVGVVTIGAETPVLSSELTGRVTSVMTADVRPQVAGVIRERLFREGSDVKKGQPLYQIDPRAYRATRDQIAAQLESARASMVATEARARRFRTLTDSDATSRQDIDDAVAAAGQARASVHQFEANLAAADLDIEFTRVLAPVSGRIGRSFITPGALVTANQAAPLATIQQLDPIFVDITQSSAQLLELRRKLSSGSVLPSGTDVTLKLEDGSIYPPQGRLEFSEVTVDPQAGTVVLRARFPNPQGLLLPGMFVRVETPQGRMPGAVYAPQQGVGRDPQGNPTALVVDARNTVVERRIATANAVGDRWVVTSGLKPGDRIIVEGTDRVKPGQTVKPVPAGARSGTSAPSGPSSAAAKR